METYLAPPKLPSEAHRIRLRQQFDRHLKAWLKLPLEQIVKAEGGYRASRQSIEAARKQLPEPDRAAYQAEQCKRRLVVFFCWIVGFEIQSLLDGRR